MRTEKKKLEPRPCERCDGTGAIAILDGRTCYACKGTGQFDPPDFAAIMADIRGRGGKGIRASRPAHTKGNRAYFVWRMVQFHSGRDITLPVTASIAIKGDPFMHELDYAARLIVQNVLRVNPDTGGAPWRRALLGEE